MQRVHESRKPGSPLALAGRAVVTAVCLGTLATAQFLVIAGATAAPARAATDPVLMTAGDIGCDPTTNTPANCPMNNTAALINSAKPGYVLALGDIQYTDNLPPGSPPTPSMYLQGYDSAWGKIPASVPGVSINPTAGNHDWGDPNDTNNSSGATLGNYIGYFNSKGELRSGVTASTPWYSFDIPVTGGSWHVIVLDNECGSDGGCGSGSPQETFLRNDLAAHPNACTIAAWHRPRFSSGAIGNQSEYAQFWTDLANAHASVVLAGSDHDYERFNPQTPAQVASSTGIAQYVVGTGGAFLPGNFGTVQPNSAFRDAGHWGVLKMTLHATSYDHAFVTTSGATEDAGTVNCSNPPPTQPAVSGLNPTTGLAGGGNSVVISGSNFTGATSVKFGTVAATGLVVNSASQITVTAPVGTPSSIVDVTVTTPNGTSITNTSDRYTYQSTQPQVSGVSPPSGPAAGGTSVTISGTNLSGATAVKFGATPAASFNAVSATQVTAVSPPGTDQTTVDVTVSTPAGTSGIGASDRFTYGTITTPPAVAAVTPFSGPSAGGNSVSITGSGFTGASAVKFGTAAAASFTVNNAGLITTTPPAGTANLLDVGVTNPAGTSGTSTADQYSYTFSNNGYAVSLSATTTSPAVGGAVNLTATANKDVGPTPNGLGIVDVTTETELIHGGSGTTLSTSVTQSSAVSHRYMGYISNASMVNAQANSTPVVVTWGGATTAPTVSGVAPNSGPAAGGTAVTITGTGFTGATAVKFGATNASFSVGSATSISATAPAGAAGPVDVTVATAAGTSATSGADQFTYPSSVAVPTVTGVSPASGSTAGGTSVVITGTGFTGASTVKFGVAPAAAFTVNNATQISATAPAGVAGTVDITVTTPGGTSATGAADIFTYVTPPPVVSGLSPTSGTTAGGTTVTISGSNFNGATGVSFGATAAAFTVGGATSITATSPAAPAGQVDVRVTTPAGTSAVVAADQFTNVSPSSPPSVTGVSPVTGTSAGGTSVLVTGANFTGATGVRFGTLNAASFVVGNAGQITAVSPSGAPGTVDITVTTPAGTSPTSAADQFTFVTPPPSVASVNPNTGPTAGGTVVTIGGSNFTPGTPVVSFGSAAGSVTSFSATSITVTAPAGAPSTVDVRVTTPSGTSPVTAADRFTYADVTGPPAVGGATPSYGPSTGGTSVIISGTNFASVTSVQFGSVAGTSFTVNSTTEITATAPAGTTTVDVTVVTSGGTSARNAAADQYTYTFSNNGYAATLAATATTPAVGAAVNITVTANKDVGPTPYGLSIIDVTTGLEVFHGGSGASGSVSVTQTAAGPHRYVGFVSNAGGANAQAASIPMVVVWGGTAPGVTGISPSSGVPGGGTAVTITGTNFTGATLVRFGAASSTGFTVNSATQIVATAPAGSGTVDIVVTTPSGASGAVAADKYTYSSSSGPVVAGMSPAGGSLAGGTAVTLTGSGFTGATAVRFGTAAATSFAVNSATSITAVAPAGSAGTIEVGVTTGAGTSGSSTADWYTYADGGPPPVPNFDHVFTIVMENTAYNQVIGNTSQAPYLNNLVSQYGLATNYTGVAHPSLPNYLALTGGTTFGVTTDCTTCFQTAPNIAVDRVEASGRTWKAYMESMPASCTIVDTGLYAVRHDPFAYYTNIQGNPSECAKIVPSTALSSDLGAVSTTPNYAWITPNLCNDIHDCSLTTGDTWLSQNVPAILNSPAFTSQNSVLFITFDEDDELNGNHVATLVISNDTPAGAQSGTAFDHYSLLRTIENAWNLPPLSSADAAAAPMSTFFGPSAPRPAVLGVSPNSGQPGGGQQVTITGVNLAGATGVRFGGVAATSFTVASASSITAVAPPHGSGAVDVTVVNANGTSAQSAADQFTYLGAPTVTGVSPSSGPPAGGTSVTITGSGFANGTPVVKFGSTSAGITSFTSTSIVVTSPASAVTGTVDVTVTTPAGTSVPSAADQFTYASGSGGPPTVTGTSPIYGPSAGGSAVVITGTNLLNATSVQFGSVNATSYTVNSPTQITATAPAGATTVDVTVVTPQGTSAHGALDEYTYTFSNNGYAITLSASTTSPAAGGSVVLTATANKDVGPTPYGISIIDVTTGTELLHVGSGATASATVSNVASTHRYVAMVSNAGGANAQAASTPVVVTWP